MRAHLAEPLREPFPPGWDAFVAGTGWASFWASNLVTALAHHAQTPTLVALVTDAADRPCAAFHARLLGLPADPRRFVRPGRTPWAGLVECRMHPTASQPGHLLATGLDAADRRAAVVAFERALRRRLGLRLLGTAYRPVERPELAALGRRLVRRVHPQLVLDIAWTSRDGYLATLAPDLRREIGRRSRRDPTAAAVEDAVPPAAAARLVEAVRARHRPRWQLAPPVPTGYFAALGDRPDVRFLTRRDASGRLLAFTTVHDVGTELIAAMWGSLDPAEGGRRSLYFDLYPTLAEHAARHGRSRVRLGRGLTELKRRYGARPVDAYVAVGTR